MVNRHMVSGRLLSPSWPSLYLPSGSGIYKRTEEQPHSLQAAATPGLQILILPSTQKEKEPVFTVCLRSGSRGGAGSPGWSRHWAPCPPPGTEEAHGSAGVANESGRLVPSMTEFRRRMEG